jgi:hypothetical protein
MAAKPAATHDNVDFNRNIAASSGKSERSGERNKLPVRQTLPYRQWGSVGKVRSDGGRREVAGDFDVETRIANVGMPSAN